MVNEVVREVSASEVRSSARVGGLSVRLGRVRESVRVTIRVGGW